MINVFKRFGLALVFAVGLNQPVAGQSVSQVLADADAKSEMINQVLRKLQSADQVTQYALVEALLKEKDPALLRIGREYALFSTNPVMQNLGVQSVFANNAQMRIVLTNPNPPEALQWVSAAGGAHDGQSGFVMMPTGDFSGEPNCWTDPAFRKCRFTVIGKSVQFAFYANGGQAVNRAQAAMQLQPDGVLRGTIKSGFGTAAISIDLKE